MDETVLVEVKNLKKYFKVGRKQILKAVDDVSFNINKGETLGLVGESGCGKTTCGRTVAGLYNATGGEVLFDGKNVHKLNKEERKEYTKRAQIIFQDPYASLDPRMTVQDIIAEGIDIHGMYTGNERLDKVYELLKLVGLTKEHALRYPHEFSGGQRQRIGIARALAIEPEFIVCDEPISALDVSIQAQIVNLLIAHDLSMVRHISDRVGVMYVGNIVEIAPSEILYKNPMHPYTQALLSSIPMPDPRRERNKKKIVLEGEVPSPINPKPGCKFQGRCSFVKPICREEMPMLKELEKDHFVACHLF